VKALDGLITAFLKNTGALPPVPNPDFKPKPVATAAPAADPLGGLKERGCKLTLKDGVATMTPLGLKQCFLGFAARGQKAPAVVEMRVRSALGGEGKVESYPSGGADTDGMVAVPFQIAPGDWQSVKLELSTPGPLGTLRFWWPTVGPVEIDSLSVTSGKDVVRWDF
jgi:hypothetical protein